jgi:TPR repeat protein
MAPKQFMCFYRPGVGRSLQSDAEGGDIEAQFALGRLYFEGRPTATSDTHGKDLVVSSFTPAFEPNLPLAVKWLRGAADQGHIEAERLLETVLAKANGVH